MSTCLGEQAATAVKVVGLDGVTLQVPRYEKSGFVTSHINHRFQFKAPPIVNVAQEGVRYREMTASDVEGFLQLDTSMCPPDEGRRAILRIWVKQPGARAVVAEQGGEVIGAAVGRPSGSDLRISPIYANRPEDASELVACLLAPEWHLGRACFIDIPEPNSAGMEWAKRAGMSEVGQTARMYRGPPPPLRYDHVYSVLSLEVG
mmetsp:Transcript_30110/g.60709  ORF Transcript_30110/g.60709 Transcript_30110/m.60709 type:complete len:204 (-) Transcript_30110:53-664(-)